MNHKINLIAMIKPRSELSRYWQCSTPHKYGEFTTSSEMKTPYRPPFESKYSILVGSDWGANASSPKRVRLFTPSSSGNNSVASMPNHALQNYLVGAERDRAVSESDRAKVERDKAVAERDRAIEERDKAVAECDRAIEERDKAVAERDRAIEERDKAVAERDRALEERDRAVADMNEALEQAVLESDAAKAELDFANNKVADLRDSVSRLQNQFEDGVIDKYQHLVEERATNQTSILAMHTRQTELANRVAYLESLYRDKSTLLVSQKANKNKVLLIRKFAKLLSPEADPKQQLCVIFDELYDKKKYFKKHARKRLKEKLRGIIRLETCREIKKLYAPWRILEVMDCSQQSLNQVGVCFYTLHAVYVSFH